MEMKEKLLEIFSPEELEQEMQTKLSEGARNERSALNKIMRENSEQVVGTQDITGLLITTYTRSRDDQMCIVLGNHNGLVRVVGELDVSTIDRWTPVDLTNVASMKNIRTGATWYEITDESTISKNPTSDLDMMDVLQTPRDIDGGGMYLVYGVVEFVNRKADEFDEATNTPTSYYPVLDEDGVNLKLVITADGKRASVSVPDAETLKKLLEVEDVSWIQSDFEEMADMLKGLAVVVLGGGDDEVGGRKVTPFIQPRSFGFIERYN